MRAELDPGVDDSLSKWRSENAHNMGYAAVRRSIDALSHHLTERFQNLKIVLPRVSGFASIARHRSHASSTRKRQSPTRISIVPGNLSTPREFLNGSRPFIQMFMRNRDGAISCPTNFDSAENKREVRKRYISTLGVTEIVDALGILHLQFACDP